MKSAHFVRKNTQLRSSFIKNQIEYHNKFIPKVYTINSPNNFNEQDWFSKGINSNIPIIDLSQKANYFDLKLFRYLKRLSTKQGIYLKSQLEKEDFDVFHFHYGTDAGIYLPHLVALDTPKVVSFYGHDCFSFPKRFGGLGKIYLQNKVFTLASKVLAMSEVMKEDLIKLGCPEQKVIVHYHGVPSKLAETQRTYAKTDIITFLMLSYLDPVKGHIYVLKAINKLLKKGVTNFRLNIVGDGIHRPKIENAIKSFNLQEKVTLHGKVEYLSTEYFKVFADADIFLHPSVITKDDKEGIPGAMVEAMFAGLPVIATYHGGIPCVIEQKWSGILVQEKDTLELATAMDQLMKSISLRKTLGENARKYAKTNLEIKQKILERESIYESLI